MGVEVTELLRIEEDSGRIVAALRSRLGPDEDDMEA